MVFLPTSHWLELSHGLWYAAVGEVNADAEWTSCEGLLDAETDFVVYLCAVSLYVPTG